MKKLFLIINALVFTLLVNAQKGSIQLQLQGEAAIPPHYTHEPGAGGYLKGAYGLDDKSQVTFTFGVSKFKRNSIFEKHSNTRVMPLLAGYKYFYKRFYIEPQVGYGEFGGKVDIGGDWRRISEGAFVAAFGGGYTIKRLDVGIRHQWAQSVTEKENYLRFTGLHIGVILFK